MLYRRPASTKPSGFRISYPYFNLSRSSTSRKFALRSMHVGCIASPSTQNAALASPGKSTDTARSKAPMKYALVFTSTSVDDCWPRNVQLSSCCHLNARSQEQSFMYICSRGDHSKALATASASTRPRYLHLSRLRFATAALLAVDSNPRPTRRLSALEDAAVRFPAGSQQCQANYQTPTVTPAL